MLQNHTKTLNYQTADTPDDLPEDERELYERARQASKTAYAPYSGFRVGSALMSDTGEIIIGSNQENAPYKVSCAERVALDQAGVLQWKQEGKLKKMALYGSPEGGKSNEPVTPCGSCRQDIIEAEHLAGEPITIIMGCTSGKILRVIGVENIPSFFGPNDLK